MIKVKQSLHTEVIFVLCIAASHLFYGETQYFPLKIQETY